MDGMNQSQGGTEVIIPRVFDAPRELVFKTCTDPALIPRWWGPASLATTVEEMGVRPGGGWRYVQRDPDLFDSAEDRDGSLQSGMEEGAVEGRDRFAALLADLQQHTPC
jgi:hypothetical protein